MEQDLGKLKYILYVLPTDLNCIRAQRLVPKQSRIIVQDIRTLPSKPAFIDGVPFLVRLEDDKMFRGSAALQEMQRYYKFLDAHFNLDAAEGPVVKVGYVSGTASPAQVTFPLTPAPSATAATTAAPPLTAPPQLPLPPPNLNADGLVIMPQQPTEPSVAMQPPPANVKPKTNVTAILDLPPPQDPTAPLPFNPLRQESNSGFAPGSLQSTPPQESSPAVQTPPPPPAVLPQLPAVDSVIRPSRSVRARTPVIIQPTPEPPVHD